jgi:cell division protein FtsN
VLQLGSYPSQELAIDGWQTLSQRHAAILGKLSSDVQAADIPNRGTWFRLRAGPFADRASAVAACEALRTQGGTCLVAQP